MTEHVAVVREWFAEIEARTKPWSGCLGDFAELELNLERRHLTVAVAACIGIQLDRLGVPRVPATAFLPAARAAVAELLDAEL